MDNEGEEEVGLSFDFEGGLDASAPTVPTASVPTLLPPETGPNNNGAGGGIGGGMGTGGGGRRSFRQTVCRHWLRGLCMKGEGCGFLHQYDKARMPVCRFYRLYGECREPDCVYKHNNDDIKDCNMYKLGFCPNGPDCRYRHVKVPGPPPPVEEVLQKIQQITSYNFGNSNRFFQNRNNNYPRQNENQFTPGQNPSNQGFAPKVSTTESQNIPQQVGQNQMQIIPNGQQTQGSRIAIPLPQGISRCVQSSKVFTQAI